MHRSFHIFERTDQKFRPKMPFYHAVAPIYLKILSGIIHKNHMFHNKMQMNRARKNIFSGLAASQKVSENDQEIPQSHTADQSTAPRGRATEHIQQQDIRKTIKEKQPARSVSSR